MKSIAHMPCSRVEDPRSLLFALPASAKEDEALPDPARGLEGRDVHFAPRTVIFLEGDPANPVYQVTKGVVMLYKLLPDGRRQVVEFLRAGDVFGLSAAPLRDCAAEALSSVRCTAYDQATMAHSPALAQRLNAALYAQLCTMHEHIVLLGRKSASERVASFLMRGIPGRGVGKCPGPPPGDDQAKVPLAMTRLEMADFLGLTIETVSRILTRLKRRGILSIQHLDEVDVCDVCRLCRMSGTQLTKGQWCNVRAER
jgi:CRP/FNR family transcriptional regulator